MEKLTKGFEAKADDAGTISGYFSTYDRDPDSYGDIVAPGAFNETIEKRKESGHPFPLCWNHSMDQIIGAVDTIEETEKGPLMTAHFFDTPLAQEKRELVKEGVVYQFSFAYEIVKDGNVTLDDGTKAHELRQVDLFEVSIVPIPANQHAQVTDIKSGRRNSAKDANSLKEALSLNEQQHEILAALLGEVSDTEEPGQAEDEPKANEAAVSKERTEALEERKGALLEIIKSFENKEGQR